MDKSQQEGDRLVFIHSRLVRSPYDLSAVLEKKYGTEKVEVEVRQVIFSVSLEWMLISKDATQYLPHQSPRKLRYP